MDEDDIVDRANKGTKEWLDRAQHYIDADKKTDAKKMLTNAQKELRALKAEVVAEEREVRAQFAEARLKVNEQGQMVGLFMNSKNRGRLARGRAASKRSLAQQKQDALEDYRQTKAALDRSILQLDRMKLDVDLGKFDPGAEDEPTGDPFAPPTPPPAAWFADPMGRHEMRYWDGTQWTPHVSTRGVQGTDPV